MGAVYVIGSSGFVGSALSIYLRKQGVIVYSVGRHNSEVFLDLGSSHDELMSRVSPDDTVVFLAAISAPDVCAKEPELAFRVNVTATQSLIALLLDKGVRVIFSSSDVVYGACNGPVTELDKPAPSGAYAEMKLAVEQLFDANTLFKVVRFSYVMGPNDKYTNMLLSSYESSKAVSVFDGFERNVVALSDVVSGIYKLITQWEQFGFNVINFSGPENVSRWALTQVFVDQYCPDLTCCLEPAPEGFWSARPKKIEMQSEYFPLLLGRQAKTINENVTNWCE